MVARAHRVELRGKRGLNAGICVVYLVWGPLGVEPVARFLESYRRHPAGIEHTLMVALKEIRGSQDRSWWAATLASLPHRTVTVPDGGYDLGSYRTVLDLVPAERYCFVNTSSELLCNGWLQRLDTQLRPSEVGLVGVGGSLESALSSAPRLLRPLRRGFARFPNAHLRTNGFMLDRDVMLDLDWSNPGSKMDALLLESGKRSISRQVWERGLDVRVVGRDGIAYSAENWRESATFRSHGQRNLLIADNRTRQYEEADAALKIRLEQMAWGAPSDVPRPPYA
jgi:hypothetical protein